MKVSRPMFPTSIRSGSREPVAKKSTGHEGSQRQEEPVPHRPVPMRPRSIPPYIPGLYGPEADRPAAVESETPPVKVASELPLEFRSSPADIPDDLHQLRQLALQRLAEKQVKANAEAAAAAAAAKQERIKRQAEQRKKREAADFGECKKSASKPHTFTGESPEDVPLGGAKKRRESEDTLKDDPPGFHFKPVQLRSSQPRALRRAG